MRNSIQVRGPGVKLFLGLMTLDGMMKFLLVMVAILLMLPFGLAKTVTYNYYDDFSSLNSSAWYIEPNSGWSIYSGTMRCYDNGAGFLQFLPDFDFTNDFIIEFKLTDIYTGGVANFAHYADFDPNIMNKSSDQTTSPKTYWRAESYYPAGGGTDYALGEVVNDSYTQTNHTIDATNISNAVFRYVKTNYPDGTFHVSISLNGTLLMSANSVYNWSSPALTEYDNLFFKCHQNINHHHAYDWMNITVFAPQFMTVSLVSPTVNKRDNQQLNVRYMTNLNGSCSLYIDGNIDQTNPNVVAGNIENFTTNLTSDGQYYWYVNCTDNETWDKTDTLAFIYDTSEPVIRSLSPSVFNDTVFTGNSMTITGNVTDNSVFRVNRTIYYPNGTVFYNNFSGNLTVNTTLYSWNDIFNTSSMPNGKYRLFIESADSHTARFLAKAKFVKKNQNRRQLSFGFADNTINVTLIDGNVLGQFESINTTKYYDRYSFELHFRKNVPPNSRMVFRVSSLHPIHIMAGSSYPAHMITGDNWIDFAGVAGDIETKRVDGHNVDVFITTKNNKRRFEFKSLGGLNEDNISIEFEINNCKPNWVCNGYASCNISDLAPCNSVTDTNNCSESYTGDYSEFSAQTCNYCSATWETIYTDCVNHRRNLTYILTNNATCCNVTGLESDCTNNFPSDEECSPFAYEEDDVAVATFDSIVKFILSLKGFITFIVVVLLYSAGKRLVAKNVKK